MSKANQNTSALLSMYKSMLRIRIVEEALADLYPDQEMRCPIHLSIGQEAVSVGVCEALDSDDYVIGAHRSHGQYLARGGDLISMVAELYGKVTGCSGGKGGSMHLIDLKVGFLGTAPIVGSTIAIGTGAAFGIQMRGENGAVVAFFGDGAVEQGSFYESLNFASLKKLPIVFVCENNLYSVYSPMSVRQPPGRSISEMASAIGVSARRGDGNDVEQVFEMATEAVQRARGGGGPAFLEFSTYRYREHAGPDYDQHLGYRSEAEFQRWRDLCPVESLERRLKADGTLTTAQSEQLKRLITEEMDAAVARAKADPYPEAHSLEEDVYAT